MKKLHSLNLQLLLQNPNVENNYTNILKNIKNLDKNMEKYVYLMFLLKNNEKLFYKVFSSNIQEIMPIVYTYVFIDSFY